MKSAVKAWLVKAEADAISARREFRARNRPNFDSACFHAPTKRRENHQGVVGIARRAGPQGARSGCPVGRGSQVQFDCGNAARRPGVALAVCRHFPLSRRRRHQGSGQCRVKSDGPLLGTTWNVFAERQGEMSRKPSAATTNYANGANGDGFEPPRTQRNTGGFPIRVHPGLARLARRSGCAKHHFIGLTPRLFNTNPFQDDSMPMNPRGRRSEP